MNNWTTTYNDENGKLNGKFLAVNLSVGVKENTQIFAVKLKVKKDIKKTSTKINFKDLTSNDGTNLVNVGTKTVELTVKTQSATKLSKTIVKILLLVVVFGFAVIGIKNIKRKDIK